MQEKHNAQKLTKNYTSQLQTKATLPITRGGRAAALQTTTSRAKPLATNANLLAAARAENQTAKACPLEGLPMGRAQ